MEMTTGNREVSQNGIIRMGLWSMASTTQTSLKIPESAILDEWMSLGEDLRLMDKAVQWWIGDWWIFGGHKYGERAKAAAKGVFGRAFQTLRNVGSVARAFEVSRRRDTLDFNHHAEVVGMEQKEADELLDMAETQRLSTRELRSEVSKRRNRVGMHPSNQTCTVKDLEALVSQGVRYGTIYADPPWLYDNQGTRAATSNHYGGMTVDEICALPVRELALDDSHLHLWTTNAFLFDCKSIFDAWGFEFRSSFVWCKTDIGIGNYWRNSHELLLTAVRGDARRFNDHSLRSWFECSRGKHSGKPEQVRSMIERASPPEYLELFGRSPAEGWTVWGNEVESGLLFRDVKSLDGNVGDLVNA